MARQDVGSWALPRLSRLLPLDEESLQQIIDYTLSLSKEAASEHLKNLLGDAPQALDFIASFNQQRPTAPAQTSSTRDAASTGQGNNGGTASDSRPAARRAGQQKKKQGFNKLPPPRQIEDHGEGQHAYMKKHEGDYMSSGTRGKRQQPLSNTLALNSEPEAQQLPKKALPLHTDNDQDSTSTAPATASTQPSKLPPSAAGPLISDSRQSKSSRTSSPARTSNHTNTSTKINLTGGASMRGATTTLNDLDSAIRTLEAQTNPTLPSSTTSADALKARHCPCQAQRHALLAAAPNCLNCGKIVCAKEGLGPCTFCGTALLSREEVGEMLRSLKEERGREKMAGHNASHRRAEVAKAPRAFASTSTPGSSAAGTPRSASPVLPSSANDTNETALLASAKAHRDRLLAYQSQNTRRTRIHDEAADYETPSSGTSIWASPQERALQLKAQQRVLREQEWNARPEYEKRRMVVSLDVMGGKAVRRMQEIGREEGIGGDDGGEQEGEADELVNEDAFEQSGGGRSGAGAGFARNPLLGNLTRPVWRADEGKGKGKAVDTEPDRERKSTWRRVQDDDDDNERWILDGGALGYAEGGEGRLGAEEHAFG